MTSEPSQKPSDRPLSLGDGIIVPYPEPSTRAVTAVMRGNRSLGSRPEMALRRQLHAAGLRYRVNLRLKVGDFSVRPDIVFPRAKVAVFMDGCFWHGCPQHGTRPRSNTEYWQAKIGRNISRDQRNTANLQANGWIVVRLWEHDDPHLAAKRIHQLIKVNSK